MQYKMQFTVLDDAVKQNRKLPEIAFFDTDGNLIHLGGGDGGGDVSALLPLDGSRAMTGPLGFSAVDDTHWGSLWFDENDEGFFLMTDPDVTSETDLYVDSPHVSGNGRGSVDIFAGEEDIVGWAGVSVHAGAAFAQLTTDSGQTPGAMLSFIWGGVVPTHGRILRSVDNYFSEPYFAMGSDGKIEWGDGTAAPDVVLARAYGGLAISSIDPLDPSYPAQLQLHPRGAILHQPVSSDLNAIHYSGFGDDLDWRYKMFPDGSMQWGDGTAAPDVTLERDDTGIYQAPGVGDLRITGQHALIFDLDVDYATSGAYYGRDSMFLQRIDLGVAQIDLNNGLSFGPSGGGGGIDVSLKRASAGVFENPAHGGGFKLTSPDGSQTKTVRLSNAGALEIV